MHRSVKQLKNPKVLRFIMSDDVCKNALPSWAELIHYSITNQIFFMNKFQYFAHYISAAAFLNDKQYHLGGICTIRFYCSVIVYSRIHAAFHIQNESENQGAVVKLSFKSQLGAKTLKICSHEWHSESDTFNCVNKINLTLPSISLLHLFGIYFDILNRHLNN